MKLKEIYELAIRMGIEKDVRGPEAVAKILARNRAEFERLEEKDVPYFDQQTLINPFSDSRILHGDGEQEIESAMVGIDVELQEVLLADRLREKGKRIDLMIAHHPEGIGLAGLHGVMDLQADLISRAGVPINIGDNIMAPRIAEVKRNMMGANHQRAVDAAQVLDIPFICIHTPADNLVNDFVQTHLDARKPVLLEEVLDCLLEIPEYSQAKVKKSGPELVVGDKRKRAGRIMVDFTGGTSGSPDVYQKLEAAGVGTVVCMHLQEKHRDQAKKCNVNVVVAGHMASDSLGLNLVMDQLETQGVSILPVSGYIRISRIQG